MIVLAVRTSTGSLWGGPIALIIGASVFFGVVWLLKRFGPGWAKPAEQEEPDDTVPELEAPDDGEPVEDPGRQRIEDHGSFQISHDGDNYTPVKRRPWQ